MILHTGNRTDLPAFYAPWLRRRLEAGFVLARSPYRPSDVIRYRLTPDLVDLLVFCTKNPAPMLAHWDILTPYGQYWFVTITPYGPEIEPNVPPPGHVIRTFQALSRLTGPDAVAWRYDPVFLSPDYPLERHPGRFLRHGAAAGRLYPYLRHQLHRPVRQGPAQLPGTPGRGRPGPHHAGPGAGADCVVLRYDPQSLRRGRGLGALRVDCSGCMTVEVFERALGARLTPPRLPASRSQCACYLGCDIGEYDTCAHFCRYCYANHSPEIVRKRRLLHDPASPLLIGADRPRRSDPGRCAGELAGSPDAVPHLARRRPLKRTRGRYRPGK